MAKYYAELNGDKIAFDRITDARLYACKWLNKYGWMGNQIYIYEGTKRKGRMGLSDGMPYLEYRNKFYRIYTDGTLKASRR